MSTVYDPDSNIFSFDGHFLQAVIPVEQEYDINNYEIHYLQNKRKDSSENSIYRVFFDDVRIGWIFPIQALISCEHEYADDKYFLRYAYIGYLALIDRIKASGGYDEYSDVDELYINDFIDASIQMLIIDLDNVKKLPAYDYKKYRIGITAKGYVDENINTRSDGYIDLERDSIEKNLKIKSINNKYCNDDTMLILLTDTLPSSSGGYAMFHILYQVIEILIDKIFRANLKRLLDDFKDEDDVFSLKDDIVSYTGERERIKKLFNDYSKIKSGNRTELADNCNTFLKANGKDEREDMASALYDVRCFLVHHLYSVNHDDFSILKDINHSLFQVLFDTLLTFEI